MPPRDSLELLVIVRNLVHCPKLQAQARPFNPLASRHHEEATRHHYP